MSVCDSAGVQLHPDQVRVPPITEDDDGEPVVVVRFTDSTTVTTVADMCAQMGVSLSAFQDAMAGLVGAGWLTPLDDGTYAASTPGAA